MPIIAVVGAQWGDEGKGKVVDNLAQSAHVVVRATGGNNAGHTIVNEFGELALHLIPAGIFNPDAFCIIAGGTVARLPSAVEEVQKVESLGVSLRKLFISKKVHLTLPWHIAEDAAEEKRRSKKGTKIGTTLRGIGPTYADKARRINLRAEDLLCPPDVAKEKLFVLWKQKRASRARMQEFEKIWEEFRLCANILAPFVRDTEPFLWRMMDEGKNILLEGAQGTLLDVDDGTYPYVTSSGCTSAALAKGAGIPPQAITRVVGVVKAYCTRVGEGPFPTELIGEYADTLREKGHEYGATTGRPRRVGWLDVPLLRYACRINGFTELALTKLDVFSKLGFICICTEHVINGIVKRMVSPVELADISIGGGILSSELPWNEDLASLQFEDFPRGAREFVEYLERLVGVPVRFISTGPKRDQMILR